jgi:hypothetical protein
MQDIRPNRVALASILAIFVWFTWRCPSMFYTGDDLMNRYWAWILNPWKLAEAQLSIWTPIYRPLGGLIYRLFYEMFGLWPAPLYGFCWILLLVNLFAAYRMFRALTASPAESLIALALVFIHGSFQDLYLNAGTMYDRLCFLFMTLAVTVYARSRQTRTNIPLGVAALIWFLFILALDSKESAIALPLILVCYELVFIAPKAWSGPGGGGSGCGPSFRSI